MAKYIITDKAGRFVAGHRNTGAGTILELLPRVAEYEVTLGALAPVAEEAAAEEPVAEEPIAEEPVVAAAETEPVALEPETPKKKRR